MPFCNQKSYRVYGENIISSYPLSFCSTASTGKSEIEFNVTDSPKIHPFVLESIYTSSLQDTNGLSYFQLYRSHEIFFLRLSSGIDFEYSGTDIICHSKDISDPRIEAGFLGAVLAFWLEMHNIIALHASAVVVENQSLIFLADSMSGKSSLAASFIQAGFTFLSDDIVPIEKGKHRFLSRPGYPIIKLWPAEANHFFGNFPDLQKEIPEGEKLKVPIGLNGVGQFASSSTPICCLYLPQRIETADGISPIQIIPITPRDAVIEILRHSFASRMAEAAGFAAARLATISEIARTIPVKRLIYPSGYQNLPQVRDALLADLSQ